MTRYRQGRQSPVNIWLERDGEDVQVAMARTPHQAAELVAAANRGLLAEAMDTPFEQLTEAQRWILEHRDGDA